MGLKKRIDRAMFYRASRSVFEKAKYLRDNMTEPESILWGHLKNKQIDGFRFKAQHPISRFIADFYCHKAKLVIEIDGQSHDCDKAYGYDHGRSFEMERFGIRIIRFANDQVKENIVLVKEEISKALKSTLYTQ